MKMDETIDKNGKIKRKWKRQKNISADICCTTHSYTYEKNLCQIWEELILKSRNVNGRSKRNENWLKYKND